MALNGMQCVNSKTNTIKILRVHFSCNKSLENNENHRKHINIEKSLKLWRMRQVTLEGKILIFKNLVILRIISLSLVKYVTICSK